MKLIYPIFFALILELIALGSSFPVAHHHHHIHHQGWGGGGFGGVYPNRFGPQFYSGYGNYAGYFGYGPQRPGYYG